MMLDRAFRLLTLSFLVTSAAACAAMEDEPQLDEAALQSPEGDPNDPGATCPNERVVLEFDGDAEHAARAAETEASASACSGDWYFHPNNGSHGGWIEDWRLCHRGGNQYQICRGGWAPVRFYNPASCGGTVHNWYPQGWNGWAQTISACCVD
jgi:hypothetical protein